MGSRGKSYDLKHVVMHMGQAAKHKTKILMKYAPQVSAHLLKATSLVCLWRFVKYQKSGRRTCYVPIVVIEEDRDLNEIGTFPGRIGTDVDRVSAGPSFQRLDWVLEKKSLGEKNFPLDDL